MAKQLAILAIISTVAAQRGYLNRPSPARPNSSAGYRAVEEYTTPPPYFTAPSYDGGQEPATPVRRPGAYTAPPSYNPAVRVDEYDPHPRYTFAYNVHDPSTGDFRSQREERDGDTVRGSYTLIEPEASSRTVQYSVDSQNGFNEPGGSVGAQLAPTGPAAIATPVAYLAPRYGSNIALPSQANQGSNFALPSQAYQGSNFALPSQAYQGSNFALPSQAYQGSNFALPSQEYQGSNFELPSQTYQGSNRYGYSGSNVLSSNGEYQGSEYGLNY